MSFEWRTDEERGWDQAPPAPQDRRRRLRLWRRARNLFWRQRRLILSGLLLLVAAGSLGVRALTLRLEAAEAAAREDVRAAHRVLLEAVSSDDAELYLTMVTADRSWRRTQLTLFEQNAAFRRDSLGFEWVPEAEPATEVVLSPDLQQAVVTSTLHYHGYTGSGDPSQFALHHVSQFENDGTQWRLAPHEDAFWGGWKTADRNDVLLAFPARDEALAIRLAADLNGRMDDICDAVAVCAQVPDIQVRLERITDRLAMPLAFYYEATGRFTLELPAPSLVGIPTDESAYQALLNGYTRQMIIKLLDYFADQSSPSGGNIQQALRQRIFVDLNLAPWPVPQVTPSITPPELEEDILALCVDGIVEGASLWRYQSGSGQWAKVFAGWHVTSMASIDGAPGVLIQVQQSGEADPQPRIVWWRDGRQAASFDELYLGDTVAGSPALFASTPEQQQQWIWLGDATNCNGRSCAGTVALEMPTTWSPDGEHTLFRRELEGSRSPPAADDMLWLGDGEGVALRRVDEGFYPFWIDDDTFGYLAIPAEPQRADAFNYDVIIRNVDEHEASEGIERPVLTTAFLEDLLPDDYQAQELGLFVNHVLVHPARPQTIYLVASRFIRYGEAMPQYSILLFALDWQTGEATLRIPTEQVQWTTFPEFSHDGRWLAYVAYDPLTGDGVVAMHDLEQDAGQASGWQHTFVAGNDYVTPTFEWSQHNGSLLLVDQGVLHIVQPGTWAEWQLTPPVPGCSQAVWANT